MELRPAAILLVEDDAMVRAIFAQWLHEDWLIGEPTVLIREASSIKEAMQWLQADHTIGLVVLDMRLIDSAGLEGLNTILPVIQSHYTPPIPVILVSGYIRGDDSVHALIQGADDVLEKTGGNPAIRAGLIEKCQRSWLAYQGRKRTYALLGGGDGGA